jgi:hypothetical protein
MKKFIFSLLFIAVIGFCAYYCIVNPHAYYAKKSGIVIDKFRSPHEKVADEFILIVKYPSGVEQESVNTDTYYNAPINSSITFNKRIADNDIFAVCTMVGIITAVIFILFLCEYEEPKKKVKDKFNFDDYVQ